MSNNEYTLRPEGKPIASYKDLEDLRAENARLREALEQIEMLKVDWSVGAAENLEVAVAIARAALKETT